MTSRLGLAIRGKLSEHMAAEAKAGAHAVTRAMKFTSTVGKDKLRGQVRAAGMGNRLANTWRSQVYPKSGVSMKAAALVFSRAPKIVDAFDRGVSIRSKSGFWLAVPLPAAGKYGLGRKRITPGGFERRTGIQLRFVYRRTGPSMLVAENAKITKAGNVRANVTRSKKGTYTRLAGRTSVPVFLLYPQVKMPRKLDVGRIENEMRALLPRQIAREWMIEAQRR